MQRVGGACGRYRVSIYTSAHQNKLDKSVSLGYFGSICPVERARRPAAGTVLVHARCTHSCSAPVLLFSRARMVLRCCCSFWHAARKYCSAHSRDYINSLVSHDMPLCMDRGLYVCLAVAVICAAAGNGDCESDT
jgi:hypothetical protein